MTTYPLPTLGPTVNENGIFTPTYNDILESLKAQVRAIYGTDTYLEPDSQDGQLLAIVALAIADSNAADVAVYNQFSPATAVGAGLSSVVKINGIKRLPPSNSTVDLLIVGEAGLVITNGVAGDEGGNTWNLPSTVTIEDTGQVVVTAIASAAGDIRAEPGTVNLIQTPTPGWQTVDNPYAAVPGAPVETDFQLRQRQTISVALPSLTVLDGLNGAIAALPDVIRLKTYENDGAAPDDNGIPGHAIAVVVEGGDAMAIANAIALKKTPGCGTYGSVAETVLDQQGVPNTIRFFPLRVVTIYVEVTLTALQGYSSTTGSNLVTQLADFISTLPIGYPVYLTKVISATELPEPAGLTYDVTSVRMRRAGTFSFDVVGLGFDEGFWDGPLLAADVDILFNEAAFNESVDTTLIVNS